MLSSAKPMDQKYKIFLISLGCSKNLVDSENILGLLENRGFALVSKIEEAEVAIINTCGFIQAAVEESIDTILEVALQKKKGHLKKIFVLGCFVQRYGSKLPREIPEVDGWLGTGEIHRIADILDEELGTSPFIQIGRPEYLADHRTPRNQTTPFYSAYLKIAEGCSHKCTFCTIPSLRGPLRSRKPESIILEAEGMVERGVKEINLIAQDTTMFGRDVEGSLHLEDLLERLSQIPGVGWIRLLYSHPNRISERLLDLLNGDNVICSYLDLPLQHVNEYILKAMGRDTNNVSPWQIIERIRSKAPQLSLRTTMMVGFPGETEAMFEELCRFVKTAAFEHLGTFIYSREKGTPAAKLGNGIEQKVAEERLGTLMELQAGISKEKNRMMIGKTVTVLNEGVSEETDLLLAGRTQGMAPEVDGQVLINKGQGRVGEFAEVRITEAHTYDLIGEIV
jgi:ribosomal protein S12 methylthiotransferase